GTQTALYRIHAGGGEPQRLANLERYDIAMQPDWSAAGITLSVGYENDLRLGIIPLDGANPYLLGAVRALLPRWSPDDEWIVYADYNNLGTRLYRIRPDGSERFAVTDGSIETEYFAAWHGDTIIFSGVEVSPFVNIY